MLPCARSIAQEEILEDFSSYKKGKIPEDGWKSRNGDPHRFYSIDVDGQNQFLRAHDINSSIQLFRAKGWNLSDKHVFSWRWRVNIFPKGSNELKGPNDSAAGVYVVFPNRWFVPEAIKYVWSEKLPVGTIIRRNERFPTIVIRSGLDNQGKWITEQRDIYKDFQTLFGRTASNVIAFGVLTDSNATQSEAAADYDDFKASKEMFVPTPSATEAKK